MELAWDFRSAAPLLTHIGGASGHHSALPAGRFFSLHFRLQHQNSMDNRNASIFVIDDDESVRDSVGSLLRSVGLHVEGFESTESFLRMERQDVASCLLLDVCLPGMN